MEFGEVIEEPFVPLDMNLVEQESIIRKYCDQNSMRFVGWNKNWRSTGCLNELFSCSTVNTISRKVTELTMGIGEDDRPIVVPTETICSVMSEVFISQRPKVGDIYSRYIIPDSGLRNDVQEIIQKTIEIIYSNIKNSLGMEKCNSKLTIWDSVLGEGNNRGLQAISRGDVKIRHKRPQSMFFFSNY